MSSQYTTSPFSRSRVQALKWESMLDVASILFNEKGHTGMSLTELSQRLDVSKRTVYNYFENKDDLIYHCYERTIRVSNEILEEVGTSTDSGLDQIRTYVQRQLSDEQPPLAVVTEINSLPPERAARLRADARRSRQLLQRIIRSGIADGSIAPCTPTLTAMAIFSILSWVPMWFSRSGTLSLDEVAATFERLMTHGLRLENHRSPSLSAPRELKLSGLQPGARREIAELKRDALLRAATTLFNRDGIVETSIDDVVNHLEVTKGTLYYYFDNKEELLAGCYERSLELGERILGHVESVHDDPIQRLRLYLQLHIDVHAGPAGPTMIFVGLDNLSDRRRQEIVERGRGLERRTERWIRDGIGAGSIRDINPLLARFALIGALDSLPKWYRADGANTPREIADCYFQLFSEGLQPRAA